MNATLCDFCKPLFEGEVLDKEQVRAQDSGSKYERWPPRHARKHHHDVLDLINCAQTRCLLCAALWASIIPQHRKDAWLEACRMPESNTQILVTLNLGSNVILEDEEDQSVFTMQIMLRDILLRSNGTLTFYEGPPDSEDFKHHLPLTPGGELESTGSARAMEWVKDMVQECTSSHWECNNLPTSWLPTRLVHLGGQSQPPRVVETAGMPLEPDRFRLPTIQYATLSHCWGTVGTFKLTSKNRNELYEGIQPSTIPKTYADAMETTKALGLEYIWIDSLCIVQDDPDDWQHECAKMAEVYRHGYCNIAALEATNSHSGFFRERDPAHIASVIVETQWHGQGRRLWVRGPFPDLHELNDELDNSPLHRRAWVLQERHMAQRNLHFGKKAILWECRTEMGCESGDPVKALSLFALQSQNDQQLPSPGLHYTMWRWAEILERYTNAALTFESDRFIAISALAREIQPILSSGTTSKVEYLAGLWNILIEHQLMWMPVPPGKATRRSENDQLTAPSWSWASFNGPSYLFALPWIYEAYVVIPRVLRHTVVPRSGDPFFGPAIGSNSVLEINGLCWRLADQTRNEEFRHLGRVSLHWDIERPSSRIKTANFLLPILVTRSEDSNLVYIVKGLLLHRVDHSTRRSFQRVGTFGITLSVEDKGWRARLRRCLEVCLEDHIVWPSQYGNRPLPSTPAHKVWAKAAAYQTIFLQ